MRRIRNVLFAINKRFFFIVVATAAAVPGRILSHKCSVYDLSTLSSRPWHTEKEREQTVCDEDVDVEYVELILNC